MENYRKVRVEDPPVLEDPPFPLPPDTIEMKVKDGSKIRNLMGFAIAQIEGGASRNILFSGCGRALGKTLTCVEILKRSMGNLHQITRIYYRQRQEIWEPIVPEAGLDPLTVLRHVPAVCVLLSRDPLNPSQPGYQAPGSQHPPWLQGEEPQRPKKKGAGRGGGARGGRMQQRPQPPTKGRGETRKRT